MEGPNHKGVCMGDRMAGNTVKPEATAKLEEVSHFLCEVKII